MPKHNKQTSSLRAFVGKDFISGILVGLVLGISLGSLISGGLPSSLLPLSTASESIVTAAAGGAMTSNHNVTSLLEALGERDRRIASLERGCVSGSSSRARPPEKDVSKGGKSWRGGQFPESMSGFLNGMARVGKGDFSRAFDYGTPESPPETKDTEVLLLYSKKQSVPPSSMLHGDGGEKYAAGPLLSVGNATSNCETLSIVTIGNPTDFDHRNVGSQCLALVRDNPMYHIPRFVKKQRDSNTFELSQRDVKRMDDGTYDEYAFESDEVGTPVHKHREFLTRYLTHLDATKAKLAPALERIALDGRTVVVMVCNLGQSSLLLNFVCACRARGMDLSNWVVFATDVETAKIVESLEISAFHDDRLFGHVPTEAAGQFRDETFTNAVTAKIVATHLVSSLGYDLLYQDVDLVWYKDPLRLFREKENSLSVFDIMFAYDGGSGVHYYPYVANTGFFFARHNSRTRHLFRSWLFAMDTTWRFDDQVAMNTILGESMSLTGLKVKILSGDEFPGGYRFHSSEYRGFMDQLVTSNKKSSAYIFHMNFCRNHVEKLQYMKQMGMWYAREACIGSKGVELEKSTTSSVLGDCCSADALLTCYYSDRPAAISCKDSPKKSVASLASGNIFMKAGKQIVKNV